MSLLEMSGLTKRFGGLLAVSNFDLSLDAGEIVGLIGPNGAGKTTVFHLIAGFHAPTSGEIRFKGGSIVGSKPHAICRLGLTRTFQIVQPFAGLSVIENVMVGAFNRERDAVAARRLAGEIVDFVGLGPRRDMPARSLTLSDRKRLEIARGLATRPEMLLLDEAMSGLNPTETQEVHALIAKLARGGITVVLVEHNMRLVMGVSDRILVLDYGRRLAEGSAAAVRNDPRVIEAYLGAGAD